MADEEIGRIVIRLQEREAAREEREESLERRVARLEMAWIAVGIAAVVVVAGILLRKAGLSL